MISRNHCIHNNRS